MTNDTLARLCANLEVALSFTRGGGEPVQPVLEDFARHLLSCAYEDAAKRAENWGTEDDEPTDPDTAFDCLAVALRSLKPQPTRPVCPFCAAGVPTEDNPVASGYSRAHIVAADGVTLAAACVAS